MQFRKKIIVGITIAFVVTLVSSVFSGAGWLEESQKVLSHGLYHEREIGDEIVIVAMDDKSRATPEEGGLGAKTFWPRTYYEQVIGEIEKGDPAIVLLDVFMSSESSSISEYDLLEIATEHPKVTDFTENVLSFLETPHPHDAALRETLEKYDNIYLIKSYVGQPELQEDVFEVEEEIGPLELFEEVVKTGFYNIIEGEEGGNFSTIYSIPTNISLNSVTEEHIDLKIARDYLDNKKDFEIPTENGQMLINYAKKPFGFPMISFSDVYYGRVNPEEFEGKIVLIGATANIFQDNWATPIDTKRLMPGVEIHANAIQTILDEKYLSPQNDGRFLVILAVLVLASVFVFLFVPVLLGSGFLLLGVALFPFYAQLSFDRGVMPDLIWPVIALSSSYLAVLTYRNFTEFSEKRKLKMAFSRYVSKDLAEEIIGRPELLQLGGENRNITALFLDIENFTPLCETLSPEKVVGIINLYFSAFSKVIMEHEGSVDKFEGDAIMALFGAPVLRADHAFKACEAALALQSETEVLNQKTGLSLHIRIGLATGDAIVGNVGSSERFDYTAMGDTVNIASRLEGTNKLYNTRILVNSGTRDATEKKFRFRRVDSVQLKGKEKALDVYELLSYCPRKTNSTISQPRFS